MATITKPSRRDVESEVRPPVALIAHDEEWTARSLESLLGPAGFAILRAHTGRQALRRAFAARPDLVILGRTFPDLPGSEVCRRLRADPRIATSTPILIAHSGPPVRAQRLEALRAGAWDFISLPVDASEFLSRVEAYVRMKIDADRSREDSLLDESSSLFNARGTLRRATELASAAHRHAKALACIVFAVDVRAAHAPRSPEDETGSQVGAVLASSFAAIGRTSDVVGRIGRTEFVVIAADTDAQGARVLAERMICQAEKAAAEAGVAPVQLRAGCFAVPDYGATRLQPVDLLVRATLALRRSSAEGGERIRFFTERGRP